MARAQELDTYFAEHKEVLGPLHGIPVSLKDQFHVKGVDTSMGYVGWIDTHEGSLDPKKRRNVESQIVAELLELGAIVYCKVCTHLYLHSCLTTLMTTMLTFTDERPSDAAGTLNAQPDVCSV